MIQRRTQTAQYWQERFALTDKDIGFLYDLILDDAKPVSTSVLAQAVIKRHCRQEEDLIQAELSRGEVYEPGQPYEEGQTILFPALDYRLGTVTGTRPGRNPEYGDFVVIQVEFDDEDEPREFASALEGEHRLNRDGEQADLLTAGDLLSPAELYEQYGDQVEEVLDARFEELDDFISFGDEWFLQDALVEIDLGQLNIAEALIEIKSMPLPTTGFLPDLDLPAEASDQIKVLSLNRALEADDRFDNIGDTGRDLWYLGRLTPGRVVNPPERLLVEDIAYDRNDISDELRLIEREIDDEGSGEEVMGPSRPLYKTAISLIYPHWRMGTLPLTVRTRGLFPESSNHHTPIILVDGQSGAKMQGWVVHDEGYVFGLENWYKRHNLPVGALIKLARTRDPRVVSLDFEPRRMKRLWGVVAVVRGRNLVFERRKLPVSCDYEEQLTVFDDNAQAIDRIWEEVHLRGETLLETMVRMMPELIKISPQQGTVHAKTIYSAVNVLRRIAPGPIFALLSTESCFVPMGGGYWTFDELLVRS
ncbi:MAG: hypothetical protein PVI80_12150 [Anaerolineae bacterium]